MGMVAQKRLMIVKQGTFVSLMPFNQTTVVSTYGGTHDGSSCYIPSNIIPVIERRLPR
jgi:hypothetical protein